jgi:pyruvate,water dikinase
MLLDGTAAASGAASGAVRRINGLDDFGDFRAGEVLVCRATSPAWTPLLARAAAVVAETGGMLSHTAIVAREFGIPAVVAVPDALSVLVDGQVVLVDGTSGRVIRAAET